MKWYQKVAQILDAYKTCIETGNREWEDKHEETLHELIAILPHGSGSGGKTLLNFEDSSENKIVIDSKYYVMEEGCRIRWIPFTVTITPHLIFGIDIEITGRFDDEQDEEYLHNLFYEACTQEIQTQEGESHAENIH